MPPRGNYSAPGSGGSTVSGGTDHQAYLSYVNDTTGDALKTTTATTTSTASYSLTLTGSHARTLTITLSAHASTYVGPWTWTGTAPGGGVQTEAVTIDAGGGNTYTTQKCFAPGSVSLSRPAQSNTSGSFTAGVGDGFGLPSAASEEGSALAYAGHLTSFVVAGEPYPLHIAVDANIACVIGPTASPPYGRLQFQPAALGNLSGVDFAISYVTEAT